YGLWDLCTTPSGVRCRLVIHPPVYHPAPILRSEYSYSTARRISLWLGRPDTGAAAATAAPPVFVVDRLTAFARFCACALRCVTERFSAARFVSLILACLARFGCEEALFAPETAAAAFTGAVRTALTTAFVTFFAVVTTLAAARAAALYT